MPQLTNVRFFNERPAKGSGLTIKKVVNKDGQAFFFAVFADGERCVIAKSVQADLKAGRLIDSSRACICRMNYQIVDDEGCIGEVIETYLLYYSKGPYYSQELQDIPNRFLSVRDLCVRHANGTWNERQDYILNSEDEMFEYMKRYGKMHYAKLMSAFSQPFPQHFNQKFDIIDWGCGQALATMSFIEKYGNEYVNSITLIEPSQIVIERAVLHCRKFAPKSQIHIVCKRIEDITYDDFNLTCNTRIHLLSNILDVLDTYQIYELKKMVDRLLSDNNYFVCVSPYICDDKTENLESFMNHFQDRESFTIYHNIENTRQGQFWACNNSFGYKNVSHGSKYGCCEYYDEEDGCEHKWTRVIKVFFCGKNYLTNDYESQVNYDTYDDIF